MYATVKSVINNQLVEYPIEYETVAEMHAHAQTAGQAGLLAAVTIYQIVSNEDPAEILSRAYTAGHYIPYTLEFPGDMPDEEGLTDITPAALGRHHLQTVSKDPALQEIVSRHVQGNCTADPCKVEQLYRALELGHVLRPATD